MTPEDNAFTKQLHLLLTGYGYNLYDDKNRARADDQLVRTRAATALGDAAARLSQIAQDFHTRCIPPSTRENPYPPAETMQKLRDLEGVRDTAGNLASRLRAQPAPTQDRTWAKYRQELPLLQTLLHNDYDLISRADGIFSAAKSVEAEQWTSEHTVAMRGLLQAMDDVLMQRDRMLQTPV